MAENPQLPVFRPVRKERAFEAVLGQLREQVRAKRLGPGDRLPPERDLAESLAVSRSTLREALRLLEALGLVDSRPGGGTVLRQPRLDAVFASLGAFLYLDEATNQELFEIREALEGLGVQLAAARATPGSLAELHRLLTILLTETDAATLSEADFQFHRAIMQCAGNTLLFTVWEFFSGLISDSMHRTRNRLFNEPWLGALADQHRLIYECIAAQDATAAHRAIQAHLSFALEQLYSAAMASDQVGHGS